MPNTYSKRRSIVSRHIAGETLLIPVEGKVASLQKIYALNSVGEYIWNNLDGRKSREQILQGLIFEFGADEEEAATDMQEFLQELEEADLIETV